MELDGVPETNIVTFDETNFADDPGRTKLVLKRDCKYPASVINQSKAVHFRNVCCCSRR